MTVFLEADGDTGFPAGKTLGSMISREDCTIWSYSTAVDVMLSASSSKSVIIIGPGDYQVFRDSLLNLSLKDTFPGKDFEPSKFTCYITGAFFDMLALLLIMPDSFWFLGN